MNIVDNVDNIYICPHCGNKNLTITKCDNLCGTIICYYCDKESYYDKNGNIMRSHSNSCISKN
jgi:transcription elongation factor Elf1